MLSKRLRAFLRVAIGLFLFAANLQIDAAALAATPDGGLPHQPVQMRRDAADAPPRETWHENGSNNWSGYALETFVTGTRYTSAQGSWIVPGVTNIDNRQTAEYSASWVGIGGSCLNAGCTSADSSLLQLGTEQDVDAGGTTSYYAWYEMLPNDSILIPYPVQPGDAMTASLKCVASCSSATQTWLLTMTDTTADWFWSKTVTYASSMQSAEWIEESPSSSSGLLPFADFGIVTFQSISANGSNPNLSLDTNGISRGGQNTGNPSAPQGGTGFSVCWGPNADLAPCVFAGGPSPLAAAILPSSRSIQTNKTATAFATIVNGGTVAGTNCDITALIAQPFSYQATDPVTNAPVGSPNTPVTIAAGASQSFVISLTPAWEYSQLPVVFEFACANLPAAANLFNLDTLLLTSLDIAPPDVVALAATTSGDGTLHIAGAAGRAAFAVAAVNVGTAATITAQATVEGTTGFPVTVEICQTDPATSRCTSALGPSVVTAIAAGAEPTFAIFANAAGSVPFSPAVNRILVQFIDALGAIRGMTSVAVTTH